MKNREKFRYVFTSSNTRQGFHSFVPELISGLKKVYVLQGAVGSGKAAFMRLLAEAMAKQGFRVEVWVSSFDLLNPEGVFFPEMEAAVVNGGLLDNIDLKNSAAVQIINLDIFRDQSALALKRLTIEQLYEQLAANRERAIELIQSAGTAADDIKKVAARHINREKVAVLTDNLAERIINQQPEEKHYFASAVTAEGMINYIDTISHACSKRYIFTGPAGSGKAAIISEIAGRAKEKGFSVEYYHSGFDIDILSAIIIRNLQVALIDAGYLAVNLQPGDEIIAAEQYLDSYDHKLSERQTMPSKRQYEVFMQEAQQQLENAQLSIGELKRIYAAAIDLAQLDRCREEIIADITAAIKPDSSN